MLREDWVERHFSRRGDNNDDQARWGFRELDDLCPLRRDDLVVVGVSGPRESRRPITALLALRLAFPLAAHGRVAVITPTSAAELAIEVVAAASGVATHRVRSGYYAPMEEQRVDAAVAELQGNGVYVDDRLGLNWAEFEESTSVFCAESRAAAVVVDRPELLQQGDTVALSIALKALSCTIETPILAITRTRSTLDADQHETAALPGRGGIGRAADLIAVLEWPSPARSPTFTTMRSSRGHPSCTVTLDGLGSQ